MEEIEAYNGNKRPTKKDPCVVREACLDYSGSYHMLSYEFNDRETVIERLKAGLPIFFFEELQEKLQLSMSTLADIVNIPLRTIHRRKKEGRFHMDESERVFRICNLFETALSVLGGPDEVRRWMKSPKKALGGKMPLEYADTEPGAREVEELLGRLEYGVFS